MPDYEEKHKLWILFSFFVSASPTTLAYHVPLESSASRPGAFVPSIQAADPKLALLWTPGPAFLAGARTIEFGM